MIIKEIETIERNASTTVLNNHDAAVMTANYALKKAKDDFLHTLVKAFMGGIYIGFGYTGFIIVYSSLHNFDAGFAKFVAACVFPVGLMLCIFVGGDLFTGNALVGLGVMLRKVKLSKMLCNWATVLFGNLLGGLFLAFILLQAGMLSGAFAEGVLYVTHSKLNINFVQIIFSGFLCNILVAGAIWMCQAVADGAGRILACFFVIMLFALSGYHHVVANMYLYSAALFAEGSTHQASDFVLPLIGAAIGNAISGGLFLPLMAKFLFLEEHKQDKH